MKIVVIGAGGVGGYFGAQLAAHGEDVAFVVRGSTLAAMRANGLRIDSSVHPVHLPAPKATDDPASLGPADIVMFAVKMQDASAAARLLPPLVGPRTLVVPFQNGIEAPSVLAEVLHRDNIAAGVAYISSYIAEPGVVRHVGQGAQLRVGPLHDGQKERLDAFVRACQAAGIDATLSEDIRAALWEKFVFLVAISGITALTRQPVGVVRADPDMRATLQALMDETWALARAEGVALPEQFVAQRMALIDKLPADMRASMAHDLDIGKPLEAPWLAGAVVRLARQRQLAVPVNATVYAAMKPYLAGR